MLGHMWCGVDLGGAKSPLDQWEMRLRTSQLLCVQALAAAEAQQRTSHPARAASCTGPRRRHRRCTWSCWLSRAADALAFCTWPAPGQPQSRECAPSPRSLWSLPSARACCRGCRRTREGSGERSNGASQVQSVLSRCPNRFLLPIVTPQLGFGHDQTPLCSVTMRPEA